jgi:hypothetical protein
LKQPSTTEKALAKTIATTILGIGKTVHTIFKTIFQLLTALT